MKLWRVLLKTMVLFLLCNGVFAFLNPLQTIQKISIYNYLVDGRNRLPYSRNPDADYSLPLLQIEGLFATHEINQPTDNFSVVLIGDSSVWGWQLAPTETLSACLNQALDWRFYNLGYPLLNVTKDLLILDQAMDYDPDWVIWFITLEALYPEHQLNREIIQANLPRLIAIDKQYPLHLPITYHPPNWLDKTIIGQRKPLANWLRLQLYGIPWQLTGIDHRDKAFFAPVRQNFPEHSALLEVDQTEPWKIEDLALDILGAGIQGAGGRVLLVNQPIYIHSASQQRYNDYYPKWAYDSYRTLMNEYTLQQGWHYADFWDAMPPEAFTDSSFHLNAAATCQFAKQLTPILQELIHANP